MEQHRDEHIACADCGASFLFSASEAAVFAERGLASPKRCKDCRRARKERAPGHDHSGAVHARPGGQRGPGTRPRYTGDVNEYRSPMQDSYSPVPAFAGRRGPGVVRTGGHFSSGAVRSDGHADRSGRRPSAVRSDGRSDRRGQGPAPWGGETAIAGAGGHGRTGAARGMIAPRRDQGDRAALPLEEGNGGAAARGRGGAPPASRSRRPQAEMFSITCNACGVTAEVPFRPAEGRDVFCQACYRARKPA